MHHSLEQRPPVLHRAFTDIFQCLGIHKLATSSYHTNGNGGIERVNYTMALMLAMVVNERQDNWDLQIPRVEFAYNTYVSATTDLASNEVHMDG